MAKTKAPRARTPRRGTMLRKIEAASRPKATEAPENQPNSHQNNKKNINADAANELEEERKLFNTFYCTCANKNCKNGENGTRKRILGRPYGGIGAKDGVCSTGCQKAMDLLNKEESQRKENEFFERLKERGVNIEE